MKIPLESAVDQFLQLGRQLQADPNANVKSALAQLVDSYRHQRVEGTEPEQNRDMLLLQWGAQRAMNMNQPRDLRMACADINFEEFKSKYINITRQIHVSPDDEDDFDGSAIQASITLVFDRADGSEPSSNLWISEPASIDVGLVKFLATPFVAEHFEVKPARIVVIVETCG